MYIHLLCLRYLRTRYIALASIISVMLGVATMIVVNSVMSGFAQEMQKRLHGIQGDITLQANSAKGFPDVEGHEARIREVLGDDVTAMTPLCVTAGIINFRSMGQWYSQEVYVIGVDENTKGKVGDFSNYLQHPENREQLSFSLHDGGYDVYDHQMKLADTGLLGKIITACAWLSGRDTENDPLFQKKISPREVMREAGWEYRRKRYSPVYSEVEEYGYTVPTLWEEVHASEAPETLPYPEPPPEPSEDKNMPLASEVSSLRAESNTAEESLEDPFLPAGQHTPPMIKIFDPTKDQHPGAVVGIGLAMVHYEGQEVFLLQPGDDFKLTFPTNTTPPTGVTANFTCVDLYESKMSETDAKFVFLPLATMQELRGMADPSDPRMNRVNRIQMTLRPGANLEEARDKLRQVFTPLLYQVETWRDSKMALLQAVETETQILNVLLFMIIAVSGFGILAIFFMVVVEKTRDIGVLKALGASAWGVMSIFLMYGLSLGMVGAGMGCIMGLLFVWNINEIAELLSWMLGHQVFNPDIYFFHQIPYDINPLTVTWIVAGALLIAVLASILPAWRAARLQPVESLRYE